MDSAKRDIELTMDERFKIFVEQLIGGAREEINISCDASFLDVNEESLHFESPVTVQGEAYVADKDLILHFDATANALIPCSICNEDTPVEVKVINFYHAEPLEDIRNGFFNFQEILRETILTETPQFAECEQNCPKRKEIAKYMKTPKPNEGEGYQPFADINLDQFKP